MPHASQFEIERASVESMLIAGIRMRGRYSDCGQAFSKLGKTIGRHICGKPMCLHFDAEYRENDADFEACFPIRRAIQADGISVRELPAIECVRLIHLGPYEQLSASYARIMEFMKANDLEVDLPTREVYLKGPGMIFRGNPRKYLTQVQLPVRG